MESNLRHILHFDGPDVGSVSNHVSKAPPRPNLNANNLIIDETSNQDVDAPNPRKRSNPSARLAYPRKRAIRACQKCRLRRTKCDNVRPACTACIDLGAGCVYSEGDPSTYDTASLAILEKLNLIEDLLRQSQSSSQPLSPARNDLHVTQTPASQISAPLSGILPEQPIPDALRRMSIETILSWPAFAHQSPDIYLKSLLKTSDSGRANSARPDIIRQDTRLDDLLQRYLDNVFIYNPILEEATLHEYVREIELHSFGFNARSCLLLLIYANGCLTFSDDLDRPLDSTSFLDTPQFRQAEDYFTAAQHRMGPLLCKSSEIEAQCFFLAGVYLMATLRPMEAWQMFVQALTCCQAYTMDLTIQDDAWNRAKRLHESIWWTCFKSELELRLELNVSQNSIWDLSYPLEYPTPPEGLRTQREAVWYYYLAEIALRRLSNRILNSSHKTNEGHPKPDFKGVIDFEEQAEEWISSLPPDLNFKNNAVPANSLYQNLRFILEGHLIDCYEMMYWPFLTEVMLNDTPSERNPELEALAYRSLYYCVSRIQRNEHGFFSRHHGTWLMLRSCTRSALVLIAARKDPVLVNLLPNGWEQAVWKVANMLRFWRKESLDCEDRLRIIERSMSEIGPAH